jgi:hypothetical protein
MSEVDREEASEVPVHSLRTCDDEKRRMMTRRARGTGGSQMKNDLLEYWEYWWMIGRDAGRGRRLGELN